MMTTRAIFSLNHVREMDDGTEEVKFIGLFGSRSSARACIAKYKTLPGFRDFPKDFVIEKEEIDKIYWQKGFQTSDQIQIKRFKDYKDE